MNLSRFSSLLALSLVLIRPLSAAEETPLASLIADDLQFAAAQYGHMLQALDERGESPRSFEKGKLTTSKPNNWTAGFFPGSLWYLFEATGDPAWRKAAERYTATMEPMKTNRGTHDLGFMLYCPFGNGLRLTQNPHYRDVLLTAADSLSTRYNPTVRAIKSWDRRDKWPYPVIIDNMMNLELLLWASETSGNPQYREIALAHADTTLKNHFRPDGSSFHVVDYDPATGKVRSRVTHQGYADSSAWARGQAWGLYGYTMMYRETKRESYLAQAKKIAAFLMHHPRLPADKVPYWDFDAPDIPNAPRDASAAAIMCSALLDLAKLTPGPEAAHYRAFAVAQLRSLSSPAYRAPLGENGGFLLMHSTANYPQHGEVDVPLPYADYYWLEALLRAKGK